MIRNSISIPTPQAILFDMDGVICNTQMAKNNSVIQAIQELYSMHISPDEVFEHYNGMRFADYGKELLHKHGICIKNSDIKHIQQRRYEIFYNLMQHEDIEIKGAVNFIKNAYNLGIKLAIASGSTQEFIEHIVNKLNIKQYFSALVSSSEVKNGKPYPDVYIEAARRIEINTQNCIVIEDAKKGMEAGKAAGCQVIGFVENIEDSYPTHLLVRSFEQIQFC